MNFKLNPLTLTAFVVLCPALVLAQATEQQPAPSWTDSIVVSGDLRLRYEGIRQEGNVDRHRGRYRARLGLDADIANNLGLVFGLASGGDDPVSTNQSFGDGFSTKDVGVDLIYVNWAPISELVLVGGKMPKPWFRPGGSSLIWDSDLNPEGVAASYEVQRFFANAGSFVVEESGSESETLLNTLQGGTVFNFSESSSFAAAASYYGYNNIVGKEPFFLGLAKGNTVDAEGNFVYDYKTIELMAQYRTMVAKQPILFFGQWARNTATGVIEDTAFAFGAAIGRASSPGSWQLSYTFHDTGADAVVGTFTDSDFANGNTDSRGHYIRGRYRVVDHVNLGGTLILSEFGEFAGNKVDYDRIMIDLMFDF